MNIYLVTQIKTFPSNMDVFLAQNKMDIFALPITRLIL